MYIISDMYESRQINVLSRMTSTYTGLLTACHSSQNKEQGWWHMHGMNAESSVVATV